MRGAIQSLAHFWVTCARSPNFAPFLVTFDHALESQGNRDRECI